MVLDDGGRHTDYYAYATGNLFPVLHSTDLVNWQYQRGAMDERPSWACGGEPRAPCRRGDDWHPWAPSVIEKAGPCPGTSSARCYVMYYVALNTQLDPDTNCIGVATSTTPPGPFDDTGILRNEAGTTDASGRPIGCGDDAGYSNIDPAPFVDSGGSAYLYLSTTDRCDPPAQPHATCPNGPRISFIPLTNDLLRAAGPRVVLFGGDQEWEQAGWGSVVENPWLHKRGDSYYLFYSGGDWTASYGMGYAVGSSPAGPFEKRRGPIIADTADVRSAGGGMLTVGPRGGDWLVYHGRPGSISQPRFLRIDPIRWNGDDSVSVDGPSPGQPFLP